MATASRSRSTKTATQSERIRQKLADDILLGIYPPGARLDETTLANQFRLSRTPVREALRELVSAGLIDLRPHRGAFVSLPSDAAIAEMFEVMGELEASCARFAAQRISPSERVSLSKIHQRTADAVRANDIDAYRALNFDFHDVIYRASHNAFLATTAQAVRQRIAPFRRAQFEIPNRLQKSHDEHGAIIAAILGGKSSEAAEIIRHHVNVVGLATRHYVHELGPHADAPQETQQWAPDHQAGVSEGADTFPA